MNSGVRTVIIRAASKLRAELNAGGYVDPAHAAAIICTDVLFEAPELRQLRCSCRVQCLDTEDPGAPEAFTPEQAALIRDFLAGLPEDVATLYCCCDYGQSRSAGLAAACMKAFGQDEEAVFRNRAYTPNLLVYARMCQALGCGLPSQARLRALRQLHDAAVKAGPQRRIAVKRVLAVGDAAAFARLFASGGDGAALPWPARLAEDLGVPVELRATGGGIPGTERELLEDRQKLGQAAPGDLLLVMKGLDELCEGLRPEEIAVRLRKYLIYLLYTRQGGAVLLLPPDCPDGRVSREKLADLTRRLRALAGALRIEFADACGEDLAARLAKTVKRGPAV